MNVARLGPVSHELGQILVSSYAEQAGAVHLETAVGAAAAIAGELALRAVATNLPESGWIVGGLPDHLLYVGGERGEVTLWDIVRGSAEAKGADVAVLPAPEAVVARTAAAIGSSPFPPLTVPRDHYPREWSPNATVRFRDRISVLFARAQISRSEAPFVAALTIALFIANAPDAHAAEIAATLALEIMIGTARMAPLQAEIG